MLVPRSGSARTEFRARQSVPRIRVDRAASAGRRRLPVAGLAVMVPVVVAVALFVAAPRSASARRNGLAGASCFGCHNGGRQPVPTLTADVANPAPGQTVTLTLTIPQVNGVAAGFSLDSGGKGTLRAFEAGTTVTAYGATHTAPRVGSGGSTVFKVQWIAPAQMGGAVFYAGVLSANNDNTTRGDGGGETTFSIAYGCAGSIYYIDQDGDGFGSADPNFAPMMDCSRPAGWAPTRSDCNDFDSKTYPSALELCDMKDNDCDQQVDEGISAQMICPDADGDGHGRTGSAPMTGCPTAGYGLCDNDCNDNNTAVYPGAPEVCDFRDNNCDGRVDEGARMGCGTGWCRRNAVGCDMATCTPGSPVAEVCNLFDDDCDGVNDNGTDLQLCAGPGLVCRNGLCMPGEPGTGTGGAGPSSGGTGGRTADGGAVAPGTGGQGGQGGGKDPGSAVPAGCTVGSGSGSGSFSRRQTAAPLLSLSLWLALAFALGGSRRPRR